MPVGLLGKKVGMTQVYNEAGDIVPVTVIQAGPCPVLTVRTKDRDGYEAVQIGYGDKPRRLATKADRGQVAVLESKRKKRLELGGRTLAVKPDCEPQYFIREFRTEGEEHGLEIGQKLDVNLFAEVKAVDVIATSKGRGYAGVMKRHNFSGLGAAHGTKKVHRSGGSTGQRSDPSKVFKGTKMSGQYGNTRTTIRNLKVVKVDLENNLLLVKGSIPGPAGQYIVIRHTNKFD